MVLSNAPENPVTLGDKIRKGRIELGFFQKELAEIIGVSEDTIRNWEKNKALLYGKNIRTLGRVLGFQI